MKKILSILLIAVMLFPVFTLAENTAEYPEIPEVEFVPVPVDAVLTVEGDFSVRWVSPRVVPEKFEGGIQFYKSEGYCYELKARSVYDDGKRVDFYGSKQLPGTWGGFLMCEEYYEWLKDCFVSVDEGWDASKETAFIFTVHVRGNIATMTMEGNVTGTTGTVHFDLTKSAWKDWEETENEVKVLTAGTLNIIDHNGKISELYIDADTYAKQPFAQ